jgi:hypothetical protein
MFKNRKAVSNDSCASLNYFISAHTPPYLRLRRAPYPPKPHCSSSFKIITNCTVSVRILRNSDLLLPQEKDEQLLYFVQSGDEFAVAETLSWRNVSPAQE